MPCCLDVFPPRTVAADVFEVGHPDAPVLKQTRRCHGKQEAQSDQTDTEFPPLVFGPIMLWHRLTRGPAPGPGDRNEEWGHSRRWSEVCSSFLTRCANGLGQHWGRQTGSRSVKCTATKAFYWQRDKNYQHFFIALFVKRPKMSRWKQHQPATLCTCQRVYYKKYFYSPLFYWPQKNVAKDGRQLA